LRMLVAVVGMLHRREGSTARHSRHRSSTARMLESSDSLLGLLVSVGIAHWCRLLRNGVRLLLLLLFGLLVVLLWLWLTRMASVVAPW
jgi:hypothetical protein